MTSSKGGCSLVLYLPTGGILKIQLFYCRFLIHSIIIAPSGTPSLADMVLDIQFLATQQISSTLPSAPAVHCIHSYSSHNIILCLVAGLPLMGYFSVGHVGLGSCSFGGRVQTILHHLLFTDTVVDQYLDISTFAMHFRNANISNMD